MGSLGWRAALLVLAGCVAILGPGRAGVHAWSRADEDCHSDHYCMICKCRILFRGDPPTEVPIARGVAPRNCICPYSRTIRGGKRCSPEALGAGAFEPGGGLYYRGSVGGAGVEAPGTPARPGRVDPVDEAPIMDPDSIPKEIDFGGAPKPVVAEPHRAPAPPIIAPPPQPMPPPPLPPRPIPPKKKVEEDEEADSGPKPLL